MISDLLVACRGLRRSPAFTVGAIVGRHLWRVILPRHTAKSRDRHPDGPWRGVRGHRRAHVSGYVGAIGNRAGDWCRGGVWLTRLLKSLIFGVNAEDPRTLSLAGFTLLGISVLAATGPAVHAALSDPAKVLRRD